MRARASRTAPYTKILSLNPTPRTQNPEYCLSKHSLNTVSLTLNTVSLTVIFFPLTVNTVSLTVNTASLALSAVSLIVSTVSLTLDALSHNHLGQVRTNVKRLSNAKSTG